jgi:hypothetical protein
MWFGVRYTSHLNSHVCIAVTSNIYPPDYLQIRVQQLKCLVQTKIKLEVSGVRGANSEASPHVLFPFNHLSFHLEND